MSRQEFQNILFPVIHITPHSLEPCLRAVGHFAHGDGGPEWHGCGEHG